MRCQRYGHTKYYCHLKPRLVKCAGNHPTIQCQCKERSSDISMCPLWRKSSRELQGIYGLQGPSEVNLSTPPSQNLHTSSTTSTKHRHATRSYLCLSNQKSYTPIQIDDVQYIKSTPPAKQRHTRTKNTMKGLFEQMGTMLKFITTVFNKLK
jgi:hypothetical protein